MKKIEAIIRPEKLERVSDALIEGGHHAMTVTEVRGRGAQKGIALQFRGKEIIVDLIPKVKIEMVVEDKDVEAIISIIKNKAHTGKNGDGKIFTYNVDSCTSVRN
ncbi:P-II family nitrogen regulator [Methanoplanus sp. FWC-SCC4]|uniref:P-II family nitrogen regulator n=1 Tax=Methanochimaera problematica TaxID=2609417 RepID=A0AA97FDU9_9EURY|nr:P-II family nitrogen regulator [Methanoplanus sp. FWC-SCC4]WOF16223.1 P-II family nitrogen regulator [Methanoplanus sp. FWC-SCC4]